MLEVKCHDRLAAAKIFAGEQGLAEQLQAKLDYLCDYGSTEVEGGRIACNKCVLGADFAPNSFAFDMYRPTHDGDWKHWFSGGLIYQGPTQPANGGFPSLTVSLHSAIGWFVHT